MLREVLLARLTYVARQRRRGPTFRMYPDGGQRDGGRRGSYLLWLGLEDEQE